MKYAKCHPDQKHLAHGLCAACYHKEYYAENKETIIQRIGEWGRNNKDKIASHRRTWKQNNKEKVRTDKREAARANPLASRKRHLRKYYDITPEIYDDMLREQDGVCGICRSDNNGRVLCVDHNHETGEIRGLLCGNCNVGIGRLKDSAVLVESALRYLQKYDGEKNA